MENEDIRTTLNAGVSRETLVEYMQFLWPSLQQYKPSLDKILFEAGEVIPQYAMYICPLCLKHIVYTQPEVSVVSTEFSCDHFPPKNVGGKAEALVCKPCNNIAGHSFDHVTADFLKQRAFGQRIADTVIVTKVRITGVPGQYVGEITIDEKGDIGFSFMPEKNRKGKPLQDWLKDGIQKSNWKAEISIPISDQAKVTKAFIKAAYLACFHQWGYEFIFSDTGKYLREVLDGSREYPFKNVPAFVFDKAEHLSIIPLKICFITQPKEWQVFAVNVPLYLKKNKYRCLATVLIPGPGKWEDLTKLNDLITDDRDREVSFTPLEPAMLRKVYNGYSSDATEMYKQ